MAARILLVGKQPLKRRLAAGDLERLARRGAMDPAVIESAAANHELALAAVRAACAGQDLREKTVAELHAGDADDVDLIVTAGGDGTVFTANALAADRPMITINSDPDRSIGHFTRCLADGFAALLAAWLAGRTAIERIPRLVARVLDDGSERRILNDCLFTSSHPAAITRYLLELDGQREFQESSGVWIATAAGSTGGIRSAGLTPPMMPQQDALLFKVREAFPGRRQCTLVEGRQEPPRGLRLTSAMAGVELYIDGPHHAVSLKPGGSVEFAACAQPLRLVVAK